MRRTALFLAAATTAALPFTISAGAAAADCDNPDEVNVADLSEGEYTYEGIYIGAPLSGVTWDTAGAGLHSAPTFLMDVSGSKADLDVAVTTADPLSDYDVVIEDLDGNELIRSETGEMGHEAFLWEGVEDCLVVKFRVFNFIGSPVNDYDISFTVA